MNLFYSEVVYYANYSFQLNYFENFYWFSLSPAFAGDLCFSKSLMAILATVHLVHFTCISAPSQLTLFSSSKRSLWHFLLLGLYNLDNVEYIIFMKTITNSNELGNNNELGTNYTLLLSCPFYKASITQTEDHVPRLLLEFYCTLYSFIYLFIWCVWGCMPQLLWSSETVCENQVLSPAMWVPGVKPSLSVLEARVFSLLGHLIFLYL